MPKPRVYVETTIPSFYYATRTSPEMVARRNWTRVWWADAADHYELLTSAVVYEELNRGTTPRVALRQALLRGIPVLRADALDDEIVSTYLKHKLMPAHPTGDAHHLAIASRNACDFIVTWNCRHLANPRKALHIGRINAMLGLHIPVLATPLELLQRRTDERRMDRSG
jgi:predicted nucleic acid-binding protein